MINISNFNYRINKSKEFEQEVIERFKQFGIEIVPHGLEYTHPELHKKIINYTSDDETSLFIRFQPDRLFTKEEIEKTCFVELKYSNTIEKNPFYIYKKLSEIGCKILICIKTKYNDTKFLIPFEKLNLFKGNEKNPYDIPIDNDNWLAPRLLNDKKSSYYNVLKYARFLNKTRGSGTNFRYFNFKEMKEYQDWYNHPEIVLKWLDGRPVKLNLIQETLKGIYEEK